MRDRLLTILFLLVALATMCYAVYVGDIAFAVLWLALAVWCAVLVVAFWRN